MRLVPFARLVGRVGEPPTPGRLRGDERDAVAGDWFIEVDRALRGRAAAMETHDRRVGRPAGSARGDDGLAGVGTREVVGQPPSGEHQLSAAAGPVFGTSSGGSCPSIISRSSSAHGGSTSDSPNRAASSSIPNPGPSVDSSIRIPPGSRT